MFGFIFRPKYNSFGFKLELMNNVEGIEIIVCTAVGAVVGGLAAWLVTEIKNLNRDIKKTEANETIEYLYDQLFISNKKREDNIKLLNDRKEIEDKIDFIGKELAKTRVILYNSVKKYIKE